MHTGPGDYEYGLHDADAVALNWSQLKQAVGAAEKNDVVYVPGHCHIETTDTLGFEGITLASQGATIEQAETDDGSFWTARNAAVHGFDLRSQTTEFREFPGYGEGYIARGIQAEGTTTIRNCTFEGWGHAGVTVGRDNSKSQVHVGYCSFENNPMGGFGYGIETAATVNVTRSYFNNNRHSIAAQGDEHSAWFVERCHQGPDSVLHAFDTHKPECRRVEFRENISELTSNETIRIRGDVNEGGVIKHNWFKNERRGDPGEEGTACRVGPAGSFAEAGVELVNNLYDQRPPEKALPTFA